MTCTLAIDCNNTDLSFESIIRRLVVIDGDDWYLKVNDCNGGTVTVCSEDGTFTNADLTGNRLAMNHDCASTSIGSVMVIDPSGAGEVVPFVLGDLLGADTSNYVTVDFGAPIGAGTFTWVVMAKI